MTGVPLLKSPGHARLCCIEGGNVASVSAGIMSTPYSLIQCGAGGMVPNPWTNSQVPKAKLIIN